MKLTKNIKLYGSLSVFAIVAIFIANEIRANLNVKAMRQDIVYAIAYSKDLNSRGEIDESSTSLKGANTGQLLTNIIDTGTVKVEEDGLGGRLVITLPNVGAYHCPDLVKEFNRFIEAKCQNDTLVLYGV
jgi:hypothetical protein